MTMSEKVNPYGRGGRGLSADERGNGSRVSGIGSRGVLTDLAALAR